ncbi:MAG: tetratricopeptide repeat protein [Steroidobacter sp.]
MRFICILRTALLLALFATHAQSEPYVPDNEAVVLERLPAGNATRQLDPLRRKLKDEPRDVLSAMQLAQGYLQIGRETSDPRFVSYAQATLSPWMQRDNPPAAVLVLSATALQSSHRFEEALTLLDRALAIDSRNAQAWLTKATLLQVRGDFPAARAACQRLLQTADQLIALTCISSVDSLNGQLEPSYRALARVSSAFNGADAGLQSWVLGQLAEMAVRLRDFAAAEKYLRAALRASPEDAWLKGAHADLLLLESRDAEVIDLLAGSESQDILLLRLAIAGKRLGAANASRWAQMFDARRRAARRDDSSHLREHARFLLEVRNAPAEALQVARENWRVQREPADVRVYLQSALRAREPQAAAAVSEWIRETGYEDRTLQESL